MGSFLSGDAARERFGDLLDRVDAAYRVMGELPCDEVGNRYRVEMARRLETQERLNRALMYRAFGQIADPPDETTMVPDVKQRLAARLRIPVREVTRRFKMAARIHPRRQLSGPPLPPQLPAVADALAKGVLGEDHLKKITDVMDKLPSCTSADDRIDVEARAYIEACAAAVRPGRHLADSTVEPATDDRTPSQRCHDGIKLGLKLGIASGEMGSHRGHPVTVIVRTTLAELNQAAHAVIDPAVSMPGPARTGGDTALPMRDLIRMAADAIHYLAVFDEHTGRPLYLGRQTRIATADQRIICYARDGGCTRPDCTAPGYHCEVHHAPEWHPAGRTDADSLFFACGPDHRLLTDGCWSATVTDEGRLAWTDGTAPARVNRFHHADELLEGDPDPPAA